MKTNNNDYTLVSTENIAASAYSIGTTITPISGSSLTDVLTINGGLGKTVRVKRISITELLINPLNYKRTEIKEYGAQKILWEVYTWGKWEEVNPKYYKELELAYLEKIKLEL